MSEVTLCDACKKYDVNVVIRGKRYCKHCFDDRGFHYGMMDYCEENRPHYEALRREFKP